MDVNKALETLRDNVQAALALGYIKLNVAQLNTRLISIAEGFDNLDDQLSKSGPLPDAWQPKLSAWAVDSQAAVDALKQAFPTLTDDYTDEWFAKVVDVVRNTL